MFSNMMLSIFLASIANAHSWVHCVDYRAPENDLNGHQPRYCSKLPRSLVENNFDRKPDNNEFGVDRGYNFQINADGSGARCPGSASRGLGTNYGGEQNVATYEQGQTYRLTWPAKNHAAAPCTNQFIPDTKLEVFAFKQDSVNNLRDPSQNEFRRTPMPTSFAQEPHVQGQIDYKGFHRCPRFCDNTDLAFCHGSMLIPNNLDTGIYTFQWLWEFNPGEVYSTCWEAYVRAPGQGTTGITDSVQPLDPSAPVCRNGMCCLFGGTCGDAGDDGSGWCHDNASNCAQCTGTFGACVTDTGSGDNTNAPEPTSRPDDNNQPNNNGWEDVTDGVCFNGMCCQIPGKGECDGMGDDGTGWCHQTASNCQQCTGTLRVCPNRAADDPIRDPPCTNCCEAGQITAPGTDTLVRYNEFNVNQEISLDCPDGFNTDQQSKFTIKCLAIGDDNTQVTLVDGRCNVGCLQEVAQSFYDQGVKESEDNSNGALVPLLAAIVIVQFFIIIFYAAYKEEVFCFKQKKMEWEIPKAGGELPKEGKRGSIEINM